MSTEKSVNDEDGSSLLNYDYHNHHLPVTTRPGMPEPNCDDYHPCVTIQTDRSQLHGVRILCMSDTHDFQKGMPVKNKLPRADILVHSGDFTTRGTAEEVANFQAWMQELLTTGLVNHVIVIAGNHELSFEPWKSKHPAVRARQQQVKESLIGVPGLHYLEDSSVELCGLRFYGAPWTLPIAGKMDWAFQMREADLVEKWALITPVDVLVTHSPPLGQGDELKFVDDNKKITESASEGLPANTSSSTAVAAASSGGDSLRRAGKVAGHIGSATLLSRVEQVQPLVHIFGHFHEGYGVSYKPGLRTVFVNAAVCDSDYQPENRPILIRFKG